MIAVAIIAFDLSISGSLGMAFPSKINSEPFNIKTWRAHLGLPDDSVASVVSTGDFMPRIGIGILLKSGGFWLLGNGEIGGGGLLFRDTAKEQEPVGSASFGFLHAGVSGGYEFGNQRYGVSPLVSFRQFDINAEYYYHEELKFSQEMQADYASVGLRGRAYFIRFLYSHPVAGKGLSEALASATFPLKALVWGNIHYSASWNAENRVDVFGCLIAWPKWGF
ncbi:MAG: hypothetical protein ABIM19_02080 [candidate division WOR-3 bacterium]